MHRDWRSKVEMYAEMRREHQEGAGIKALAKKYKVHRRMVREALKSGLPAERKTPERASPQMARYAEWMERTLKEDERAPRKQRHTAHRLWTRLRKEFPDATVAESTVRHWVGRWKRAQRVSAGEVMVPQSYEPGVELQVDFYEGEVELGGERTKLQFLCFRSMMSGGAFHLAFRRANQQAFLEGHEKAFVYFGGVFELLRYDNLTLAVRRILQGRQRLQTRLFYAFKAHWSFRAEFCNPGQGHEKGGVEGENGHFRRNFLTPVPKAPDLASLNRWLEQECRQAEQRRITGREETIAEASARERAALRPLAEGSFDVTTRQTVRVDKKGCAACGTNLYSTPLAPGTKVDVRAAATRVEIWQDGHCVAWHERLYGRHQQSLNLEHYLTALSRKPGALAGSTPLKQWRRDGRWPRCFDELWTALKRKQGETPGTRAMISLLELGARHGWDRLRQAVEKALELGSRDAEMVRHLVITGREPERVAAPVELTERLAAFERPLPSLAGYDALLEQGGLA